MACKFHAAMRKLRLIPSCPALRSRLVRLGLSAAVALASPLAQAEKADRFKPLNVEADQPGRIDLLNQHVVFNGNVVVTKGTMVIRAARIEVRESPDGYHNAVAIGAPNRPATFRQKRDGVDEYIEGEAERLEYDGKADTIRFVNNASVRRLRGATMADEISGNLISYDSITEVFSVSSTAFISARAVSTAPCSTPSRCSRPKRPTTMTAKTIIGTSTASTRVTRCERSFMAARALSHISGYRQGGRPGAALDRLVGGADPAQRVDQQPVAGEDRRRVAEQQAGGRRAAAGVAERTTRVMPCAGYCATGR